MPSYAYNMLGRRPSLVCLLLLTACGDDLGIAKLDVLGAKRHGAQA